MDAPVLPEMFNTMVDTIFDRKHLGGLIAFIAGTIAFKSIEVNMQTLFNDKELAAITEYRTLNTNGNKPRDPSKSTCVQIWQFKQRILKSLNQKSETRPCFCTKTDREQYHKAFYIYFDKWMSTQ